jgi:hypothetical protein
MKNYFSKGTRLSWHTAFIEAIQMELQAYESELEFHPEYQLTTEPLRIDCVVIKKAKGAIIKKNLAAIFREWNLLEYKSPDDYVSVDDFYKVYGYACLYASLNRVPITELTLSFIENRYPKKLLEHLRKVREFIVEEICPGIYTVSGDILPIQVIDSGKLPADENLWLKSLSNKLDASAFSRLSGEVTRQGKDARITAYLQVIAQANSKTMKEAIEMGKTLTIEQVFEDVGWIAKWEARGRAEGEAFGRTAAALETARKMKARGRPITEIVEDTGLTLEAVEKL